ncbi:glycosyltransferase [Selenomonas sp. CM52]|uniref:glycosyltransferase n=1 Tax=Selenomonas sp. CM52 TaxID=936381 RepID=UPI0008FB9ED7|nr:glycosyltransferase [Selenomonas sp. CM52]
MISVIMPVYNQQNFIGAAIESILAQTYSNFELIILDDGSTDDSLKIIRSYTDPRIRVVWGKGNRKLVPPLNDGIRMARGKYVARMDSDDISLPRRFEEQVGFLEAHPDVDICGTFFRTIGRGINYVASYPIEHNDIKLAQMFFCSFAHPAIMIRRSTILEKNLFYDEAFLYAEDYDLWSRMAWEGCVFYNIPKVLLRYRVGKFHISSVHGRRQKQLTHQIVARNLVQFGLEEMDVQPLLKEICRSSELKDALHVFDMLLEVNRERKVYDQKKFEIMVSLAKFYFLFEYTKLGVQVLFCMDKKDAFRHPKLLARLFVKVILSYIR